MSPSIRTAATPPPPAHVRASPQTPKGGEQARHGSPHPHPLRPYGPYVSRAGTPTPSPQRRVAEQSAASLLAPTLDAPRQRATATPPPSPHRLAPSPSTRARTHEARSGAAPSRV